MKYSFLTNKLAHLVPFIKIKAPDIITVLQFYNLLEPLNTA